MAVLPLTWIKKLWQAVWNKVAGSRNAPGDNGTGNEETTLNRDEETTLNRDEETTLNLDEETTLNRDEENDRDQKRVDQLKREVEQLQRENVRLKRQAKDYRKYHLVCRRLDSKQLQDVLREKSHLEY